MRNPTQFNAFDVLAGSDLGTWSECEVIEELIDILNFQCGPESKKVALQIIHESDQAMTDNNTSVLDDLEPEYLNDLFNDLIDSLNDFALHPDSTYIESRNGEVIVTPYLDDDLPRLADHPENMVYANIGTGQGFDADNNQVPHEYYLVNDHGNVDFMQWDGSKYANTWSMV